MLLPTYINLFSLADISIEIFNVIIFVYFNALDSVYRSRIQNIMCDLKSNFTYMNAFVPLLSK